MKSLKEGNYTESNQEDDEDNLDHLTIKSDDDDIEAEPELQLDDILTQQDEEKRKELRRAKKKEEKRNKDYEQRVKYGMVNKGDVLIEEEHDLFRLNTIEGKKELEFIDDVEPDETVDEVKDPDDELIASSKQKKSVTFSRQADVQYFELEKDYDEDDEEKSDDELHPEKHDEEKIMAPPTILKNKSANNALSRLGKNSAAGGGLLTDLMDINQSKIAAASKFFDKDTFVDIDLEKEFETDLVNKIAKSNIPLKSGDNELEKSVSLKRKSSDEDLSRFDDESSTDEEKVGDDIDSDDSDSDESSSKKRKKQIRLDPEGLALATMMVGSKKMRKDIEDEGWNRYAHADSHLAPKWFREEEELHCRRNIPVRQELVKEYKQRLREIDAKPIKKVMQAKARQKRRAFRKMEKVKKKVDAITSNDDITQRERINQIKTVYKNATKTKKKEVKLVVGRKGLPTKKPNKGKYKMVDSRLKKDLRTKQRQENKGKKGKKSSGGQKNKKRRQSNNSFSSSRSKKGPQKKKSFKSKKR